jgi:hypothetical protein
VIENTLLIGGPFDGHVVAAGGGVPTILQSTPRPLTLLDDSAQMARAEWNAEVQWYQSPKPREETT